MTRLLKRYAVWLAAALLGAAFVVYWSMWAADRYVSEAHVVVENLQAARGLQVELPSLLAPGSTGPKELLLLRDHLHSADMLLGLDRKLGLRAHFHEGGDLFSRLWSKDTPAEGLLWYLRRRVEVEYDDYAGVLLVRAQAYTPKMAHAIASMLVEEGGRFMNRLAQDIAREQVGFAEREVAEQAKRVSEARRRLLVFQNQHGLASPRAALESGNSVVASLEGELASLRTRQRMLASYLAPDAPDVVQLSAQVRAVEQQVGVERARLASSKGGTLNVVTEQYERLQLETEFTQDVYKTALAALEQSRVEATRTLRKVSVLQTATLPEYPLEPRRSYNIVVFVLATLLAAGIVQLVVAVIREHRD